LDFRPDQFPWPTRARTGNEVALRWAGLEDIPMRWQIRRNFACLALLGASIAGGACASTRIAGPAPLPFPGAVTPHRTNPGAGATMSGVPTAQIARVVDVALALRGTPYLLGGDSPATGFDCSGFVRYVFTDQGIDVPRTVREQFVFGRKIGDSEIQPGDLLFFSTESRGATHVGIAIDASNAPGAASHPFIHAPGERGVVRIETLETPYWQSRFVGARRLF
jgi:cell wall-associated NlpC family hydrolase